MMARGKPAPARNKSRLTGRLAEPVKIRLLQRTLSHGAVPGPPPPDVMKANAAEYVRGFDEAISRLELLFPHYGLRRTGDDAADFCLLSLAMAVELFPGFRVVDANQGEPYTHRRSNPQTLVLLLADVEMIKQERGGTITDSEAIRMLRTDARFLAEWGSTMREASSLQNWLCEARNPTINPYWPLWQCSDVHKRMLSAWINLLVRRRTAP